MAFDHSRGKGRRAWPTRSDVGNKCIGLDADAEVSRCATANAVDPDDHPRIEVKLGVGRRPSRDVRMRQVGADPCSLPGLPSLAPTHRRVDANDVELPVIRMRTRHQVVRAEELSIHHHHQFAPQPVPAGNDVGSAPRGVVIVDRYAHGVEGHPGRARTVGDATSAGSGQITSCHTEGAYRLSALPMPDNPLAQIPIGRHNS